MISKVKTFFTNDRIFGALVAGILYLGGIVAAEIKDSMAIVQRHEVRFAGVDGMVQQVIDIRREIDTIKNRQSEGNGKLDALLEMFKPRRKTKNSEED